MGIYKKNIQFIYNDYQEAHSSQAIKAIRKKCNHKDVEHLEANHQLELLTLKVQHQQEIISLKDQLIDAHARNSHD